MLRSCVLTRANTHSITYVLSVYVVCLYARHELGLVVTIIHHYMSLCERAQAHTVFMGQCAFAARKCVFDAVSGCVFFGRQVGVCVRVCVGTIGWNQSLVGYYATTDTHAHTHTAHVVSVVDCVCCFYAAPEQIGCARRLFFLAVV